MNEVDNRVISFFKIIGEPIRYQILEILDENEMTVTQLAEYTNRKIPNVSQHLRILRTSGIVGYRTKNNYVLYYLKKKQITKLMKFARSLLSRRQKKIKK